nr:hypothetical protein Iba_chr10bCG8880 [Ipomoea batatas]
MGLPLTEATSHQGHPEAISHRCYLSPRPPLAETALMPPLTKAALRPLLVEAALRPPSAEAAPRPPLTKATSRRGRLKPRPPPLLIGVVARLGLVYEVATFVRDCRARGCP